MKDKIAKPKKTLVEKVKGLLGVTSGTPVTKPVIDPTHIWANSGSIITPSTMQQDAGWGSSTQPVSSYFNYLFNQIQQFLVYINQRGICVWDDVTDYPVNAIVQGSDGGLYRGVSTPNVNHDPVGDGGTNWSDVVPSIASGSLIGEFKFLAFNSGSPVADHLDCLGQSVLRADYPDLYTAIGTTWGSVDGTHFTLPPAGYALIGQGGTIFPILGANTVGTFGGEIAHANTLAENGPHTHGSGSASGFALTSGVLNQQFVNGSDKDYSNTSVAATASSGSGTAHNNIQPTMIGRLLIRYQL